VRYSLVRGTFLGTVLSQRRSRNGNAGHDEEREWSEHAPRKKHLEVQGVQLE